MRPQLLIPQTVLIPGGSFGMGNDAGRADERLAHHVTVEAFRAGLRPVSNAEFAAFVTATGHEVPLFLQDERFAAPEQPVVGTSWHDAVAYCAWLSAETDMLYRLPTEAEREYAALGGLERADWPWGDAAPDSIPFCRELSALDRPHIPTTGCANGYGLLCMADNVHEWCSDWYGATYYTESPSEAPRGPESGKRRASRGGSWRHQIVFNRVSARSSLDPSFHYNDYGFRVYAEA